MTFTTLQIKRSVVLNSKMLLELTDIMNNQDTTDYESNCTMHYSGEYGEYEIKFDKEGNAVLLQATAY